MLNKLKKYFTEHPNSVNESYITHLFFAGKTGIKVILIGMVCICHGIFPFMFKETASNFFINIASKLYKRKNGK